MVSVMLATSAFAFLNLKSYYHVLFSTLLYIKGQFDVHGSQLRREVSEHVRQRNPLDVFPRITHAAHANPFLPTRHSSR